jgi:hypothetical protein
VLQVPARNSKGYLKAMSIGKVVSCCGVNVLYEIFERGLSAYENRIFTGA